MPSILSVLGLAYQEGACLEWRRAWSLDVGDGSEGEQEVAGMATEREIVPWGSESQGGG